MKVSQSCDFLWFKTFVLSEHLTHIILHTYFHTVVHPAVSVTVILRNRENLLEYKTY